MELVLEIYHSKSKTIHWNTAVNTIEKSFKKLSLDRLYVSGEVVTLSWRCRLVRFEYLPKNGDGNSETIYIDQRHVKYNKGMYYLTLANGTDTILKTSEIR